MGRLFGTDGIRGRANAYPMDGQTAMAAGRALAHYFKSRKASKSHVVIGRDTRLSGDMLTQAVGAGICSAGMDLSLIGVVPTPAVAYLTNLSCAAAGVMISASHNPFADNGIKIFNSDGYKLNDAAEDEIEAIMTRADPTPTPHVPPDKIGRVVQPIHGLDSYLEYLKRVVPHLRMDNLKIVLDCANGATYKAAPKLFKDLGARIVPIFRSPDGININERCGSQYPQALAATVLTKQADLGLAFDGDGDRLIAVDEKGVVLTGDQIMAICANHLMKQGKLKHRTVVSTVMSNMGLRLAMRQMGVRLQTTQVGDRYVIQKMLDQDAVLGGEDSGHIIFRDVHTTGDGLLTAIRLVDAMVSGGGAEPLSELAKIMTVLPQAMINVDVLVKPELTTVPEIAKAIHAVENELGDKGRVVVRYSGTQSKCRVMVEGPTPELTDTLCRRIATVVRARLS